MDSPKRSTVKLSEADRGRYESSEKIKLLSAPTPTSNTKDNEPFKGMII